MRIALLTLTAGLVLGIASCGRPTEGCANVTRTDVLGGKLLIMQLNRTPIHYWYRAQCALSAGKLESCRHRPVTKTEVGYLPSEEELESVDAAMTGRTVKSPIYSKCAQVAVYIRNG